MGHPHRTLYELEVQLLGRIGRLVDLIDNPHAELRQLRQAAQDVGSGTRTYCDRLLTASPSERRES